MSSTSSELNSLASTTVVDLYKRRWNKDASDGHYVLFSRWATVFWGGFAILFAMFANRLGTLVEAVNILGSLFYGTILGIFLVAFYLKRVHGTATFVAALAAEVIVLAIAFGTSLAWLWYNVVGCVAVVGLAMVFERFDTFERQSAS
jgi:SSS family solute:Na+ symporter